MIEVIRGLPSNVLGIIAVGKVTHRDCSEVLVPALEQMRVWHHKVRLYYEIRSRFPGATWDDMQLGITQRAIWERVALVTDCAWIRHTVQAVRLLIPSEVRVFASIETPDGLAWIGEPKPRRRTTVTPMGMPNAAGSGHAFLPPSQFLHHAS